MDNAKSLTCSHGTMGPRPMKYQSRLGTNIVDDAWTATYQQEMAGVDTWAPGTLDESGTLGTLDSVEA